MNENDEEDGKENQHDEGNWTSSYMTSDKQTQEVCSRETFKKTTHSDPFFHLTQFATAFKTAHYDCTLRTTGRKTTTYIIFQIVFDQKFLSSLWDGLEEHQ